MLSRRPTLIDVLTPPANQWLRALSSRKENLPAGVRRVRLSDGDDSGEPSEEAVEVVTTDSFGTAVLMQS